MIPQILNDSYKKLEDINSYFFGNCSYIFYKPEMLNVDNSFYLIGDFYINKRNHMHKFQGQYILLVEKIVCIKLKKVSKDRKCQIIIDKETKDKIEIIEDSNFYQFSLEDLIFILKNNFFTLK